MMSYEYLKKASVGAINPPHWLFHFKLRCPSVIVTPKVTYKKLRFWQEVLKLKPFLTDLILIDIIICIGVYNLDWVNHTWLLTKPNLP